MKTAPKQISVIAVGVCLVLGTCLVSGHALAERRDIWTSAKDNSGAYASECQDCEEDNALRLSCKRGSNWVDIEIPGLAREMKFPKKNIRVTMKVGSHTKVYKSGTSRFEGLIGSYPALRLRLSWTMVEKIASGKTLKISAGGNTIDVPLKGSRQAITMLRKVCR